MLRVLRGKILRPETVHASELIIAVERPLLLDKMPIVANVQAAPAQPGRTQTPFGNGRALGGGSQEEEGPSESPASLCRYQQLTERNRDSCRPLRSLLPFTLASLP